MWLIVGLGNSEKEYQKTRHNVGFLFADKLLSKIDGKRFTGNKRLASYIADSRIEKEKVIIAKPDNFMNKSGNSVSQVKKYYEVDTERIIVVSDDCNLEVGSARVRLGGSDGGHNGLKSVISAIGEGFWRVRIGVGMNENEPLERYVLNKVPKNNQKMINLVIDKAADLIVKSISQDKIENISINLN